MEVLYFSIAPHDPRRGVLRSAAAATLAVYLLIACSPGRSAGNNLVRFDTVLGDIDVRLFGTATPASVANFLNYVNDGDYVDSIIHRSVSNFVIQGGGFDFPEVGGLGSVPTDPPVVNEPGLTNIRGTLAYAKQGGDPNSATSGWFFSLDDNSLNLDFQNGGFTVFGTVTRGLDIVDTIASETIVDAGGAFTTLPVLDSFDDNPPDQNGTTPIFREDLVFVNSVEVLSFTAGDYNFDGSVDLDDLSVWQAGFGNTLRIADLGGGTDPSALQDADGNGTGYVDAADFTVFRDFFGATSVAASPAVAAFSVAVPEPSTVGGLATLLLLAGGGHGRRR